MIERLARALEHIEELPEEAQEEIAEHIEQYQHTPRTRPALTPSGLHPLAGAWSHMPDDMEDELLRLRRDHPPTPPIEEQLRDLLDGEPEQDEQ